MSRWFCIVSLFFMTAVSPSFAQPAFIPTPGPTPDEIRELNNPTPVPSRPNYSAEEIKPRQAGNYDMEQYSKEMAEKIRQTVRSGFERTAEEEIYRKRGVAIDFLNKPIKLFEMTCTTKSGGGEGVGVALGETFKFSAEQWGKFCEDSKSSFGGAVKCAAKNVINQVFQQVQRKIDEFKDQSFCRVFTDFINDQVSQCITVRFNTPRGQFPGFPALNQCMFGRLGMSVGANGRITMANGQVVADVASAHSFKYARVKKNSPTGFSGTEQQLLGDGGTSALMDKERWAGTRVSSVAASTCGRLDPDIVKALTDFPNRFGDKPWTTGTYLDPHNRNLLNYKPDSTKPSGSDVRVIAHYVEVENDGRKDYEFRPGATGEETIPAISWNVKSGYTYLVSCYGFQIYPEDQLCEKLGVGEAWREQYCQALEQEDICCDPDLTDCRAAGLVQQFDVCKDGKMLQMVDADGKPMVNAKGEPLYHDPRTGNPNCETVESPGALGKPLFYTRNHDNSNSDSFVLGKREKVQILPKVLLCEGACCNPDKNDCAEIGAEVCPKYLGVSQCVPASLDELSQFDPVYSKLRAKPNTLLGGVKSCCATEWCNLCPQDLVAKGNDLPDGVTVFMRNSELTNVPRYCLNERTNGGNPYNDVLPFKLKGMDDQIFANTQEACNLIHQQDGWDAAKVHKIFIECPQKEQKGQGAILNIFNKILDPADLFGGARDKIQANQLESNGCPAGGQVKPYMTEVVPYMCGYLADLSRFPPPISKIPRIEGEEPIGLCSELELCPANVADEENPYLAVNGGRKCTDTDGSVIPCTSARGIQLLKNIQRINVGTPTRTTPERGASSGTITTPTPSAGGGRSNSAPRTERATTQTPPPSRPGASQALDPMNLGRENSAIRNLIDRVLGAGSPSDTQAQDATKGDGRTGGEPRRGQTY